MVCQMYTKKYKLFKTHTKQRSAEKISKIKNTYYVMAFNIIFHKFTAVSVMGIHTCTGL